MPRFDVVLSKGWYEAECRELGLRITARSLSAIEETAVKAANARTQDPVVLVVKRHPSSLAERLESLFGRSRRTERA